MDNDVELKYTFTFIQPGMWNVISTGVHSRSYGETCAHGWSRCRLESLKTRLEHNPDQ